jgi:hypothetical protein
LEVKTYGELKITQALQSGGSRPLPSAALTAGVSEHTRGEAVGITRSSSVPHPCAPLSRIERT